MAAPATPAPSTRKTAPYSLVSPENIAGLLTLARQTPRGGAFVEIGVYRGGTAWHLAALARAQERGPVYLYDTFAGTPETSPIDRHQIGEFGDTSAEAVQAAIPDAVLCIGMFPDTLVAMPPVAFVHCDCDQYESVKAVCREMPPRMVPGGIIAFDDPDHLEGARRAVEESFPGRVQQTPGGKYYVVIGGGAAEFIDDSQGEASKIDHLIAPYTRGRGLDIGCGNAKPYPHFIGLDNLSGMAGLRPSSVDLADDGATLPRVADGGYDFVFSSHMLQLVADPAATLKEWFRVVRPGGHLVLYLPHRGLCPARPEDKSSFDAEDIKTAMRAAGPHWVLVEDEVRCWNDEYSIYQVYRKEAEGGQVEQPWRRPEKACLVIRFGAFGDALMASSVLPGLKAEGWHVTFMHTTRGTEVLAHDPHIDARIALDDKQIPDDALLGFYLGWKDRFDKVVNFSESVEARFLTVPYRTDHQWPDEARRKLLGGVNYVEFHHLLAGVPYEPARRPPVRFYATGAEKDEAKAERARIAGTRPVIAIALSGSPPHKTWPYSIDVVAWLLVNTNATVVTLGAEMDARIEVAGAEKVLRALGHAVEPDETLAAMVERINRSPRVKGKWHPRAGKWSMRQTLAFAKYVPEVVLGPETGIMNAIGFEPKVEKIVMLSHSSAENLTRDWVATTALTAAVPCHPCHRLHTDWSWCFRDAGTGAAACSAAITPDRVIAAIVAAMQRRAAVSGMKITNLPRAGAPRPALVAAGD